MSATRAVLSELRALSVWCRQEIYSCPAEWLDRIWFTHCQLLEAEAVLVEVTKTLDAYQAGQQAQK